MKLFDQLIFDTTKVFDLLLLTGLTSFFGLCFYLFLSWIFKVEMVPSFVKLFEKAEALQKRLRGESQEPIGVIDEPTGLHS